MQKIEFMNVFNQETNAGVVTLARFIELFNYNAYNEIFYTKAGLEHIKSAVAEGSLSGYSESDLSEIDSALECLRTAQTPD